MLLRVAGFRWLGSVSILKIKGVKLKDFGNNNKHNDFSFKELEPIHRKEELGCNAFIYITLNDENLIKF